MPLAARLAEHDRVHVVDLPGFGLSGEPGRVLDVAEHADHLAELVVAFLRQRVVAQDGQTG
jgi:pimeloyl-ACP methyl ester carboxylesterase